MHKKILEEANLEQLKEFVNYAIMQAKSVDKEYYDSLEMCLYKCVYGYKFNNWMLAKALASMENEDGTRGPKWSLDETTNVAKQFDVTFNHFDMYDWCYVLNMVYSDYYGAVPDDVSSYVKLAKKFLCDKDAEPGKAFRYYVAMNYGEL